MDDDSDWHDSSAHGDYREESTTPQFEYNELQFEDIEPDSPPDFSDIIIQEPEGAVTQNMDGNEEDEVMSDISGNKLECVEFAVDMLTKLMEFESELKNDKPFERQLGQLWNMTADGNVVFGLLQQGAMELFMDYIENTQDRRMRVILLGILANMCLVEETCVALSKNMDLLKKMLSLLACLDMPTLIQAIRVLNAVAKVFPRCGDDNEDKLFRFFIDEPSILDNICKLLNNSLVEIVLLDMLTALKALTKRFAEVTSHLVTIRRANGELESDDYTYLDMFVNEKFIKSLNAAFNTLLPEHQAKNQENVVQTTQSPAQMQVSGAPNSTGTVNVPSSSASNVNTPSVIAFNAIIVFLNVHRINLEYHPGPTAELYKPFRMDVFKCISRILKLVRDKTLQLECVHVEVVTDVNSIFAHCYYPFHGPCFKRMLRLWLFAFKDDAEYSDSEGSSSEEKVNIDKFYRNVYRFIQCTSSRAKTDELVCALKHFKPADIAVLLKEIKKYCLEYLHKKELIYENYPKSDDKKLKKAYKFLLKQKTTK